MTKRKKQKQGYTLSSVKTDIIPSRYQDLASILFILLCLLVFFNEVIFGGKIFLGGDKVAADSFRPYFEEAKQDGVFPLWIPYLFGGMPSTPSLIGPGPRWWDLTTLIWKVIDGVSYILPNRQASIYLFRYFLFGLALYLVMRLKGLERSASLIAALAGVFSTFIIVWIMIGHHSKIGAVIFFPILFLLVEKIMERFRWLDALLLVVTIHLLFATRQIQFIFYFFFAVAIYMIYLFVRKLIAKQSVTSLVRAAAILVIALGIAFAMSGDQYLSVLEYNSYSTRGAGPIVDSEQVGLSSGESKAAPEGGLTYDYATNWSFSPEELITFFIPSFYGYGIQEYSVNNEVYTVPTYFGQMPFTDAPQYMGVATLVLAAIGIVYYRKNQYVQGMIVISIIALLISFGKNFSLLYDPMFYYFPYFNKFRVPTMILILVQLSMAIMAGFGVNALIELKKSRLPPGWKKGFTYSLSGFGILLILALLLRQTVQESYFNLIASSGNRTALQLRDFLFDSMMADWMLSSLIALAVLGVSYAYLYGKVRHAYWVGALVIFVLFDLWRVDAKAMRPAPKQQLERHFTTPDYVNFIQRDTTLYRVHLLRNGQPQTDNKLAYFQLQNVYGYHAAKMRVYQDLIEVVGINNEFIWNLLNMKYLISDQVHSDSSLKLVYNGEMKVMANSEVLPRAFFSSRYEVAEPLEILRRMREGSFDPREVTFFEEDPAISVDPPETSASIEFTEYEIQHFALRVRATGNNLLFLSEVYFPAGWNATVDGRPTPIYKSNYAFRSILIPAGEHTVEFAFEPRMFEIGKTASLVANILVLGALITCVAMGYSRRRKP